MGLNRLEYVVDSRDEYGQPAIIGRYPSIQPTELKIKDDRKIPKKRRAERQALNHRDQTRLHELFVLPQSIAEAKEHREKRENALNAEIEKLKTREKDATKISPTSQPAEIAQAHACIALPSTILSPYNATNKIIWFYAILCAIFFSMAQFPDFRSWIVNEVVVKVCIEGLSPPLLQIVCAIGEKCMATIPLTSNIILSLYSVFGFWPLAVAFFWALLRIWDAITFIETSLRELVLHGANK